MFQIYNYISTKLLGKEVSQQDNKSHKSELTSFHLFSSFPTEIRRKIWHFALPSRLIEASLDFQDGKWGCCCTQPKPRKEHRLQPVLFAVNVESREFCLGQYVLFAHAYIHPTLDLLHISWENLDPASPLPRFYPIQNQPLSKFHTVAMTIARYRRNQEERFGAFVSCLRQLGSPQELLLCLVGPKLPSLFSTTTGFSISNGNLVVLLDWANKVEENMSQEVRSHVMRALEAEEATLPGFSIPEVSKRLYYIYSGP